MAKRNSVYSTTIIHSIQVREIRKFCAAIGGNFADAWDHQLVGAAAVYLMSKKVEAILDAGESGSESKWCLKLNTAVIGMKLNVKVERVKCADSKLDILCQIKLLTGTPLFLDEAGSMRSGRESDGNK